MLFRYIDEVYLTMRAKNASEILDDATLVCWHSFDNASYYDSGPLRLNGIAENISFVSGRRNQAINFTSHLSYYQVREISFFSVYLEDLYRLVDLFFLVSQFIHIQFLSGFVLRQSMAQRWFTYQQK